MRALARATCTPLSVPQGDKLVPVPTGTSSFVQIPSLAKDLHKKVNRHIFFFFLTLEFVHARTIPFARMNLPPKSKLPTLLYFLSGTRIKILLKLNFRVQATGPVRSHATENPINQLRDSLIRVTTRQYRLRLYLSVSS